jgi:hypothetical protein
VVILAENGEVVEMVGAAHHAAAVCERAIVKLLFACPCRPSRYHTM